MAGIAKSMIFIDMAASFDWVWAAIAGFSQRVSFMLKNWEMKTRIGMIAAQEMTSGATERSIPPKRLKFGSSMPASSG